jgi:SAM-dependent methyltransferase
MSAMRRSPRRPGFHGALQIIRYNWPWYAAGAACNLAALLLAASGALRAPALPVLLPALAVADFWLVASFIASHRIYDHSPIATGGWLEGLLPGDCRALANFHAGLDETSGFIAQHHPESAVQNFDLFDAAAMSETSIARARRLNAAQSASTAIPFGSIPLADCALDAGFVVFSAHELRRSSDRLRFFHELRRCLKPRGHLIVAEHLRDGRNALAFGPGVFHFISRSNWLDVFREAGFAIEKEFHITPFVTIFHLRSDP